MVRFGTTRAISSPEHEGIKLSLFLGYCRHIEHGVWMFRHNPQKNPCHDAAMGRAALASGFLVIGL